MENTQQGIHYRTGGKLTHCGCECLPGGKDIPYIVIESIEYKETEEIGGRKEHDIWIARFAPNPYTKLPMVLNATNRKRLFKLYPDCGGYINLLKNVPVRLTKETCRDAQDGGETWGLRISKMKPSAPQQAPSQPKETQAPVSNKQSFDINDDAMVKQAILYLRNGGDLETIKKKYTMSKEAEDKLIEKAKEA